MNNNNNNLSSNMINNYKFYKNKNKNQQINLMI